jgi:hypothetical protein
MELNNNNIFNKTTNRYKSVSNILTNKLSQISQIERSNSNINSSTSKKTAGFEESLNYHLNRTRKMNSFSTRKDVNRLRFSNNNNNNIIPVHQSQEFSMKDIKNKNDVNGNYTNINISIVNPNFSINNFDQSNHSASGVTNKSLNVNIVNNTLVSFKESNNIELEEKKSRTKKEFKTKMITTIYKDYLENKSNDETFSENFKDESKKNMFTEYLKKKKIIQYEYNTKGDIAGFSAYMYPNEEIISKDKICLNININKLSVDKINEKNKISYNSHLVNFFSLFCGDEKSDNDELPNFLKNNLKDNILNDKELLINPEKAIKNSIIKCELDYIKKTIDEKIEQHKNSESDNILEKNFHIPSSSLFILLNIDDMFYVGNIGNIVSLISNSYSRKINKLCKDNSNKEDYKDAYENNNTIVDKRKSINSIYFNYNCPNDDVNNKNDFNDKSDFNNSKMLFNGSFISNNMQGFGNMTNYNFIRTFPGKVLYDMFSNEDNNEKNLNDLIKKNPINNNNSNNKRISKENFMRRPSTTFGGAGNCNFKNIKLNNYVKDTNQILKNFQPTKEKDNLFNLSPNFLLNNLNYNKFYRNSFISQNTYNDIFPEIKIITSYPDVMSFRYQNNYHDFLLICCRAIFEKLTHDKICKGIYETMKKCIRKNRSFEMFLGCVVKDIIKRCISLGVTSNLSCLFICFDPIKQLYLKQDINSIKTILVSFYLNATLTNKNKFELYDNFLTFDFIDIDKANDYNLFLSKEIEKMKKIKNHLSTNIIDTSAINARPSDEDINYKNEYKYKKKSRCLPKKCNCLTY